ncbi:MAG: hypothetical protein KAY65_09525, partial [Planctomycetes bacterium]|nr:hypothetical protein [Planctomycetota bacterium]
FFTTKPYENRPLRRLPENKPNTNPNKPNLPDDQMNVNKVLTKDYENLPLCARRENKPNTNPIQTQYKPNQTQSPKTQNERELLCRKPVMKMIRKTAKFGIIIMLSNTQSDFSDKILQRNHEFDSIEPMEAVQGSLHCGNSGMFVPCRSSL